MRPLMLVMMLVALGGCAQQWQLEKPAPTKSATPSPRNAKLDKTRGALEKRLADVESALALGSKTDATAAEALRAERLRLTIALRLVDERATEPVTAPVPEPDAMLAEADGRIADAREHPGETGEGDALAMFGGAKPPDAAPEPAAEEPPPPGPRGGDEGQMGHAEEKKEERDRLDEDKDGVADDEDIPGWKDGKKIVTGKPAPRRKGKLKKGPGGIEKAMVLPGRDPTSDVEAAVDREVGRLRQCVAQGGGGSADLTVHAQLGADGMLRRVRLADAKLAPQVGDCIVRVLEGLRVPGATGEEREISVPLSLR